MRNPAASRCPRSHGRRSHPSVAASRPSTDAGRKLGSYFRRNGYVRRQNPKRLAREGYLGYKKGDEVRLTARDETELRRIQVLLAQAGFRPGRAFVKGQQYRLPIYGREAVRRFLKLIRGGRNTKPTATARGLQRLRSKPNRKSSGAPSRR